MSTASYKTIITDISFAFKKAYGKEIPTHLYQYDNIQGNQVLCGDDAAGCCKNCEQGCEGLGIEESPDDFAIYAERFTGGFSKGLAVPKGFKVTDWKSPEVATASVMYHELLHLWFYQFKCVYQAKMHDKDLPDEPSGHGGDKKIYYESVFAKMWQAAQTEIEEKWKSKSQGKPERGKQTTTK